MDGPDIHPIECCGNYNEAEAQELRRGTYEVRLTGYADAEDVRELAKAADDCCVTKILKNACNVSGIIFCNGELDGH